MEKQKSIDVTCKGMDLIHFQLLRDLQGDLKRRTKPQVQNLKDKIIQYGFSFPFFVWTAPDGSFWTIDGHGRLQALNELKAEGYEVPLLPYDLIEAKDRKEAKEKLLIMNSRFGAITNEGLYNFAFNDNIQINIPEMKLDYPDITMKVFVNEYYRNNNGNNNIYTPKIKTPIYEPTGESPELSELFDTTKTDELINSINAANIPEDVKGFLILAAQRHLKFNYQNIAEYYCNATKEIQELFEKSALVIIDFDSAIENGYVELSKELMSIYEKDYPDD